MTSGDMGLKYPPSYLYRSIKQSATSGYQRFSTSRYKRKIQRARLKIPEHEHGRI